MKLFLARRFLFSPKSHSVINVISRVSMVAVGIPVAAMVILLGVFSGFDQLIRQMYRDFDPDLLVRPTEGKVFAVDSLDMEAVRGLHGVVQTSWVLEESALAQYGGRQRVVTVRGIDSLWPRVVPLERMMWAGTWSGAGVIAGQGVAYGMSVRLGTDERMRFYVPSRGVYSSLLPQSAVRMAEMDVEGVFVLDAETDGEYVMVPLERARELFDYHGMASGLALRGGDKKEVQAAVGADFVVLDRYEQKASMYRIMQLEKWGIFAIGLAVLIIASFSIVGSLIMLMIDKRDGIATLRALGARRGLVRGVFVRQGMIIGAIGAAGGLILGLAVCLVQQFFGVIPMPGSTFLIDTYPVLVRPLDVAAVVAAFAAVNWLIVVVTVRGAMK